MKEIIEMKNISDDEVKENISFQLKRKNSDKEKIILLSSYLSKAFNLKREEIVVFLIDQIASINKPYRHKYLKKELTSSKYKFLSFKNKVEYWSGRLHGQMRNQVESCLDEYAIFTIEWYESVKKYEPKFDNIMDTVFAEKWKNYWDKNEYLKRIGK